MNNNKKRNLKVFFLRYKLYTGMLNIYDIMFAHHVPVHIQLLLQPFNGLFSRTTWVSPYQKGKTDLDFTGARDSEWQWHQLGHMQVCTSLQTDNHASTPPLCFLRARCPSYHPTNSVKALKAQSTEGTHSAYSDKKMTCA